MIFLPFPSSGHYLPPHGGDADGGGCVVNCYFKYVLNNEAMVPVAFLCLFVTAIVFMPLFVKISMKRARNMYITLGLGALQWCLCFFSFLGKRIYFPIDALMHQKIISDIKERERPKK